jgi:quinol-cytochrome oxidoreductase complex cytochrome b subunit
MTAIPPTPDRPRSPYRNFYHHLHPLRVRRDSLRPTATFGLGLIAVSLLVILVFTGLLLMFHYVPSTDPTAGAYASLQDLRWTVPFGRLVRAMHRWAAHFLVIVAVLHLARVFLRGAFQSPRRTNWLIGLGLLLVVLAESFTGYLLPWDQLAYWATVIGSNIAGAVPLFGGWLRQILLGGSDISQVTLVRFYALHVFALPLLLLILLAIHLWRIRTDGGLAHRCENSPEPTPKPVSDADTVPTWPHLVLREAAVFLACFAVVAAAALFFAAPLGEPANPAHAPEPAKAAWYFLSLQELVSYDYGPLSRLHWPPWNSAGPVLGPEFWGGVLLPLLLLAVFCAVPYLRAKPCGVGLYFAPGRRWSCAIFLAVLFALAALTFVGYFFRGPNWTFGWTW